VATKELHALFYFILNHARTNLYLKIAFEQFDVDNNSPPLHSKVLTEFKYMTQLNPLIKINYNDIPDKTIPTYVFSRCFISHVNYKFVI